jgi:hypothetical protein
VVYRKGELSKGSIDRGWPHQVGLPACRVNGANYVTVHLFCDAEKLSLCVRGHWFRRDGEDHIVFCFAKREDADRFAQKFGGEHMTPATRPPWIEKRKRVSESPDLL